MRLANVKRDILILLTKITVYMWGHNMFGSLARGRLYAYFPNFITYIWKNQS
jgi:hypothetical protein